MPLFSSTKDASLIKHINRELMHKIISIEVEIFKLSLNDTEQNLYGESGKKIYYQPVRFFCLINKDAQTQNDNDTGLDSTQTVQFKFLREDLRNKEFVFDVGDIIKFDERYYEIDNINNQQYWMGRNNETIPVTTEGRTDIDYGFNISVIVETHLTRLSQLNLVEIRSGINNSGRSSNFSPKNL